MSDDTVGKAERAADGLLVLYDFQGEGPVVKDRSGVGKPLDLRIDDMTRVHRKPGSIRIKRPTLIRSRGKAKKMIDAVKRSGAITIETWMRQKSLDQQGPARIVTLSKNPNERNFTLGQNGDRIESRLRTAKTNANGTPATISPSKTLANDQSIAHVVYTRDRSGTARIYVDGRQRATEKVRGSVGNWNDHYRFALANEITGDRPWLGELHLVAVYSRSLSPEEIAGNFATGFEASAGSSIAAKRIDVDHLFETQIATLLSQHCLECHDSSSSDGGLDLSRKQAAFAGGESGAAIMPGKASQSLLWKAVADDVMPLDRSPLSDEQKLQLKKWIDMGAAWPVDYVDPAVYRANDSSGDADLWIQRLTLPEFIATVKSAVEVDIAAEAKELLPVDNRADGFRNTAYNLNVDLQHVEAYAKLARTIVAKMDVESFARKFSKSKKLTDNNMRALISELGKHVLRGPLDEQEVVLYRGISTTVASAGGDFREAVSMVLEAMLQSPRFLYRVENRRGDGSTWPVSEYELASRVSYILWGAPPDEPLLAAADAGELSDPELFRDQTNRMLDDPRTVQRSRQFVIDWLDLDRLENMRPNEDRFPNWQQPLAQDMRAETVEFFVDLVWKQQRPLSDLLNAQFTYATPRLAKHYGFEAQSPGLQRYDLTEVPSRGGLLTQGSVLTIGGDDASMVTRGLFVLHDLLFGQVGDPPPGLDTTPVPSSPGRSHRAIAIERVSSKSCGGCHSRFEPLAFGLEMYDGLGTFHELDEHGNRLRQDGEILFPGEAKPVRYTTSAELTDFLAGSDRVSQCLSRKVIQFSLGRPLFAADARAVREIHAAAQRDGGTYRALLRAIVTSDLIQKTRTEAE